MTKQTKKQRAPRLSRSVWEIEYLAVHRANTCVEYLRANRNAASRIVSGEEQSLLRCGFTWSQSPQGSAYWSSACIGPKPLPKHVVRALKAYIVALNKRIAWLEYHGAKS